MTHPLTTDYVRGLLVASPRINARGQDLPITDWWRETVEALCKRIDQLEQAQREAA